MAADVLQRIDDIGNPDVSIETRQESGAAVIECPYCQAGILLPEDNEWTICEACHNRLNVHAQRVYARAKAAYLSVQDLVADMTTGRMTDTIYRAKARLDLSPLTLDVIRAYQQAYSGLCIAFQYNLPESQKLSGIEMMAEITHLFAPRAMISPLEAEYWTKLMIEMTVRRELQALEEKLKRPSRSRLTRFIGRWHWHVRHHQLSGAVDKLRARISELERTIGFLNPPHVH